jgi:hypothetical protein
MLTALTTPLRTGVYPDVAYSVVDKYQYFGTFYTSPENFCTSPGCMKIVRCMKIVILHSHDRATDISQE